MPGLMSYSHLQTVTGQPVTVAAATIPRGRGNNDFSGDS